ncbi:odorant receptor 49b-like [Toxorhynchites rutilus septentrionalis]|uniref:odorant receptor 49b-like n=1 Tax=Toxorhynchites rutilus septentrionalis TaxID=329112 RepID=UPI002478C049|nr:odorant receptor 49b-like [Toxorhynchites rutilus septentrionalis]
MQIFENHFSPPDGHRSLRFQLALLRFVGLWGDRRQMVKYGILAFNIVALIIAPKIVFGPGKDGFDTFVRNVAELIFQIENCISIGIFALRRNRFERLVAVLEKMLLRDWSEELRDEIDEFTARMDKFGRRYTIYIMILATSFTVVPIAFSVVQLLFIDTENDFMLGFELNFYCLKVRTDFGQYMFYMLTFYTISVFSSAIHSSLKGSVFVVIIRYGTKLFELVSKRINAAAKIENLDDRRKEFGEIVELHSLALEYVDNLEATLCFVLMNQIFGCILMWCLSMLYISNNIGPNIGNVLILFTVIFFEIVIYCINGTRLSEKAALVASAMYEYPWYNEPTSLQKNGKQIIQRAQKPTGITAAKFYFINIERLSIIVQASFSYYLFLKKTF